MKRVVSVAVYNHYKRIRLYEDDMRREVSAREKEAGLLGGRDKLEEEEVRGT